MKIIYVGTVHGSAKKLKHVLDAGGNVAAILTLNSGKGIKLHSDYYDPEPIARKYNIDLFKIDNINNPDTLQIIRSYKPDYIFIWGWSQLAGKELLNIPQTGVIGFHPSLLPKNRGRHPIIWSLANGETKTGATFLFLDEGVDSGDILSQREIEINFNDDAGSLMDKIDNVSREMILEFVPQLNSGDFKRIPQDHTKSSYLRKRFEADGLIDFSKDTLCVYNLIRALARPYPGAHTFYKRTKLIIYKSKICESSAQNYSIGEIISIGEKDIKVKTADGALLISDVEMDGKNISAICSEGLINTGVKLG